MPNPTVQSVHVDRPLTNISIAYVQEQKSFVADKVFPIVPVEKKSDLYFKYDKGDLLRIEVQPRAPSTESAGSGYRLTTEQYLATRYALHKDIDDEERANADDPLKPDRDATEWLAQNFRMKLDKDFATKFMAGSIWTNTDQTGVAAAPAANQFLQWNDPASTPIEDIRARKRTIKNGTGYMPNVGVIGGAVFDKLIDHPDIIDRLKAGQTPGGPAVGEIEALAKILGIERLYVADAVENTAAEGAAASVSAIVGKSMLLCYAAPSPSLYAPSAGYTFVWRGYLGAAAAAPQITKMRLEWKKTDRIEGESAWDQKVVASDLGQVFLSAVA